MKRIVSLLLAVVMVFCVGIYIPTETISAVAWSGSGTEADPYVIDGPEALTALCGNDNYAGKYFAVTADIDLGSAGAWTPIETFAGKLFAAKPDGTPAVIKGLTVISTVEDKGAKSAFIGTLEASGEVSGLAFESAAVSARRYTSIIACVNYGTIKNCSTDENSTVVLDAPDDATAIAHESSLATAGGICAENRGVITGSTNRASVTSDYTYAGGIAGESYGEVSYCMNYGDISAVAAVGGIVGHLRGITGNISYSGNMGDVTAVSSHVGGVAGWMRTSGGITHCFNGGTVSGAGSVTGITDSNGVAVSGIVGLGQVNHSESGNAYVVEYCYNVGDVYKAGALKMANDIGYMEGSARANYGIYSGSVTVATITKADAKSGALRDFLNEVYQTNIYTQNIGVDECPVINGNVDAVKLIPNDDGTYTTPALVGYVSNEGSLVGFRTQDGVVHGAGETISYQYVSPVYEKLLTLDYGASVRHIDAINTGIRWTAKIDAEALEAAGYEIINKGFIIAPTAYVTGEWAVVDRTSVKANAVAQDFTKEALNAADLEFIDVAVDGFLDSEETKFSAYITGLYDINFSLSYSARAYLELSDGRTIYSGFEDKDGRVYYSYADAAELNSRAPGEIAKSALDDYKDVKTGGYNYKIVASNDEYFKSQGKTGTYYAKISQSARNNLFEFILEEVADPEKSDEFSYPVYSGSTDEYAGMRQKLESWIRTQLNDGTFFSVTLKNVKGLGGYNSIIYGTDISFSTLKSRWTASAITEKTENGNKILTKTYNYATGGVKFTTTVILYGDVPTADVKTVVENTSTTKRSYVIKDFYAINTSFNITDADGTIELKTLKGSNASDTDFDMVETTLTQTEQTFSPTGTHAFSSNGDGFPYFDIIGENKGLMMAIGWSGVWEGSFAKDSAGNALIKAKQQNLQTYLEPGEEIEAPRIVLTYFEGDYEYGHNIWRESMLSHYTPDDDGDSSNGNNTKAPISANFWGGLYAETIKQSVSNFVKAGAEFDIVWMDAGWYGNLLFSKDQSSGNAAAFNTENSEDQAKWETYIAQNPLKNFNKSSTNDPNVSNAYAVWVEYMGDYVENSFLFPGERGVGQIGDLVDEINAEEGTDLKFMLWWMIFDRRSSHNNYYYPDTSGTATDELAEEAGATELQLLTQAEIDEYKDEYPGLANFIDSDYLVSSTSIGESTLSYGVRLNMSKETVLEKLIAYYKYMMDVKKVDAVRLDNSYVTLRAWYNTDIELLKEEAGMSTYVFEDGHTSETLYRKGYTENRCIVNEYRLWDALKEYNPEFFLDNTASGGRRLDIELVKRSICLWRTDLNDPKSSEVFYEAHQKQTQTLALWIPLTSAGYVIDAGSNPSVYQARSLYSAAGNINGPSGYSAGSTNISYAADMMSEFSELRPYWYGDYYQLLPVNTDAASWQAYELYREDMDEGMFVVIRRPNIEQTEDPTRENFTKTIKLKGLNNCSNYRVYDIDGGLDVVVSGAELMTQGITVTVENTSSRNGTMTEKGISAYKIILMD